MGWLSTAMVTPEPKEVGLSGTAGRHIHGLSVLFAVRGLKGTSESWLWLTQETSDIFTSVQTRREERPALVTRQLVLAVGPFRLHVPTFPSFLSPKNISHHVHLPLTFSVLLSGVVFPRPVLCGEGSPRAQNTWKDILPRYSTHTRTL